MTSQTRSTKQPSKPKTWRHRRTSEPKLWHNWRGVLNKLLSLSQKRDITDAEYRTAFCAKNVTCTQSTEQSTFWAKNVTSQTRSTKRPIRCSDCHCSLVRAYFPVSAFPNLSLSQGLFKNKSSFLSRHHHSLPHFLHHNRDGLERFCCRREMLPQEMQQKLLQVYFSNYRRVLFPITAVHFSKKLLLFTTAVSRGLFLKIFSF